MSTVLVTGANGFLGRRLVPSLAASHDVIAFSRGAVGGDAVAVRGDFTSAADLRALDPFTIDCVVHLASVLYGASEEECLTVNVLGTATLLRYLLRRGCRRVILASSIGAAGCLSADFVPREVPVGDDHPCEAVDPYGVSKAMMEELGCYLQRGHSDLELTLLRLGGVIEGPEVYAELIRETPVMPYLLGGLIAVEDVIEAICLVVRRPRCPGARRFNVVQAPLPPLPAPLRSALVAHGFRPRPNDDERGKPASIYTTDRFFQSYGFRAKLDVRTGLESSPTEVG